MDGMITISHLSTPSYWAVETVDCDEIRQQTNQNDMTRTDERQVGWFDKQSGANQQPALIQDKEQCSCVNE